MGRGWRIAGPALVALLVVTSCAGDSDAEDGATESTDAGCTADRAGGELTIGTTNEAGGLDPAQVTGGAATTGGAQMTAIYDTLMRWDPEAAAYEPQVAESLEPNDDMSEWTLTLRPGVEFGNGDPLTADAVVASIERLEGSEVAIAAFLDIITEMRVVDDLTVVFVLDAPWGDFPYFLAAPAGMIVNAQVAADMGPEAFNLGPAGAGVGPFTLERFAPGDEIVMRAKDDYWGGPVCSDQLRFVPMGDDRTSYEALRLGEVDLTVLYDPRFIQQARDEGFGGAGAVTQVNSLLFNIRPGNPGADVRVRQAVAAGLDLDLINERVYDGTATMASTIVGPESPLFTPDMVGPEYDPDRARELVDEAKADGWDGQLVIYYGDANQEEAIVVEGLLEAVGMDIEIEFLATNDLVGRVTGNANFQAATWVVNVLDAAVWARLDTYLRSDSPTNRSGYGDPQTDEALLELRSAATVAEKQEALAHLQEIWNETMPSPLLRHNLGFVTWADSVHGVKVSRDAVAMVDDVYVDG